jgi:hypothetical protein
MKFGMTARVLMGLTVWSGLALADYTVDFSVPAGPGNISYAGGSAGLVGSGITVGQILPISTGINGSSTLDCTSCVLSFNTGGLISETPDGTYTFGSGGSFTLTGTVAGLGITNQTLLSGSFDADTSVTYAFSNFLPSFKLAAGYFSTNLNKAITDYYGIPATPPAYSGALDIIFLASANPDGSFAGSTVLGGTIAATVPEPFTIVLLGTVLLGCIAIARRRIA